MVTLADLVGSLGAGLVLGRIQADKASVDVAILYRDEPLLRGTRIPRMVLSEVTIEVKFATAPVQENIANLLVNLEELAKIRPEHLSTLTLKYTEDDLEPPPT